MNNIEIWNKYNSKIPIIVSVPHSGTYVPKLMKENLLYQQIKQIQHYLMKHKKG